MRLNWIAQFWNQLHRDSAFGTEPAVICIWFKDCSFRLSWLAKLTYSFVCWVNTVCFIQYAWHVGLPLDNFIIFFVKNCCFMADVGLCALNPTYLKQFCHLPVYILGIYILHIRSLAQGIWANSRCYFLSIKTITSWNPKAEELTLSLTNVPSKPWWQCSAYVVYHFHPSVPKNLIFPIVVILL